MKQETTEYPDGYDKRNEATRHCHGGVLKEVKAEHTSYFSDIPILSAEDCSETVFVN